MSSPAHREALGRPVFRVCAVTLSTAVFFLFAIGHQGQAREWDRVVGGEGSNVALSVAGTPDGGGVVAGHTTSRSAGKTAVWVARFDDTGKRLWDRVLRGHQADSVSAIRSTRDGGYILAGTSRSGDAKQTDGWVVKLDAGGRRQWDRVFGGKGYDGFETVVPVTGGGFLLAGYTRSRSAGRQDAWVVKIDGAGRLLWARRFGGDGNGIINAAVETDDGGYVLVGQRKAQTAGGGDGWAARIDRAGRLLWSKRFGGDGDDVFTAVAKVPGGGFAIAGRTNATGAGSYDGWLLMIDGDGTRRWARTFGGARADGFSAVLAAQGGGFVLLGTTRSGRDPAGDGWVVWTDASGMHRAERRFGGAGADAAYGLAATAGKGFILAGATKSRTGGGSDGWIVHFTGPVSEPAGLSRSARGVPIFGRWWLWLGGVLGLAIVAVGARFLLRRRETRAGGAPTEGIADPDPILTRPTPEITLSELVGDGGSDWSLLGYDESGGNIRYDFDVTDLTRSNDGLILGRNPEHCHFVVDNTSISRRHVRLFLTDGHVVMEDLDSTNGTYVDGRRVAPREPVPLHSGASLIFGDFFLRFVANR